MTTRRLIFLFFPNGPLLLLLVSMLISLGGAGAEALKNRLTAQSLLRSAQEQRWVHFGQVVKNAPSGVDITIQDGAVHGSLSENRINRWLKRGAALVVVSIVLLILGSVVAPTGGEVALGWLTLLTSGAVLVIAGMLLGFTTRLSAIEKVLKDNRTLVFSRISETAPQITTTDPQPKWAEHSPKLLILRGNDIFFPLGSAERWATSMSDIDYVIRVYDEKKQYAGQWVRTPIGPISGSRRPVDTGPAYENRADIDLYHLKSGMTLTVATDLALGYNAEESTKTILQTVDKTLQELKTMRQAPPTLPCTPPAPTLSPPPPK
jgi:hypothetical protein